MFASLVIMQSFGNVFTSRTNYRSFFQRPPFLKKSQNIWIFVAEIVAVVLLILIIYLPFINSFFDTRQIPVQFFFIPLIFAAIIFFIDEVRKLLVRKRVLCFHYFAW